MSDQTNSKMSLITVGGIGIVGTLLGGVAVFLLTQHAMQPAPKSALKTEAAAQFHARIVLHDNNKCSQLVGGIRFSYPVLRPHSATSAGESIDWQGIEGRAGAGRHPGDPLSIVVLFDSNNSPFAASQFTSSGTNPTPPSGPPVGSANDYDYVSVTVDGVKCTTWDPGVHVTP